MPSARIGRFGTTSAANRSAASANGTASRKTLGQPNHLMNSPPMLGPITKARPLQLAQTPSPRRRAFGSDQTTRTIASEAGSNSAEPMPATARAAMRMSTEVARAQPIDATVKMAAPNWKARRRP